MIKSVAATQDSWTNDSKASAVAYGGVIGSLCSLAPATLAISRFGLSTGETVTISVATAPISLICVPVTAPVFAVWAARDMIERECDWGDMSPESDDEMS